jgi:hypothetical protein
MNVIPFKGNQEYSLDQLHEISRQFSVSRYFGEYQGKGNQRAWVNATPEQIFTKVMIGKSLGFGIYESIANVKVIKGNVVLAATIMAAQIRRSGKYDYKIVKHTDTECTLAFWRMNEDGSKEDLGTSSFAEKDARKAGLIENDNYQKFGSDMYFARAMSRGAKHHTPDVFGCPVYVPGELEDDDAPAGTAKNRVALPAAQPPALPAPQSSETAAQTPSVPADDPKVVTGDQNGATPLETARRRQGQRAARRTRPAYRGDDGDQPAKPEQINAIKGIAAKAGVDLGTIDEGIAKVYGDGKNIATLLRREAAEVIIGLQQKHRKAS